jgi:AraC family ethanolamine operon transcriptional activator
VRNLSIDLATFNLGLRSRGESIKDRIALSMLVESKQRVTRSAYESLPGDMLVMPPGKEHENTYYGGASLLVVSASHVDIEASFGKETAIIEAVNSGRRQFKATDATGSHAIPRLLAIVERLGRKDLQLTAKSAEFWKRAVLEAMLANVANGEASERDGPLPSTLKLVRKVDEFLDAQGTSAIHISRICGQLNVSRRTLLHRAFHETLGIGPIAFLRHRRLCAVHTALRLGVAGDETIANLAMQHGFLNVGRFADYYRRLFAEYPSQTRLRAVADRVSSAA